MKPGARFSVVIPTRDRPLLFEAALGSVVAQEGVDFEIVVVDDGSSPEHLAAYTAILARFKAALGDRLRHVALPRRARGHGSSYAMNHGVAQARGEYLCFIDDDDLWIDRGHLDRVGRVLRQAAAAGPPVDAYMANQEALQSGRRLSKAIWLESLEGALRDRGREADALGAYRVTPAELLLAGGFCHFNCLIVRRAFFAALGGLDENIRWENDREFFLRMVDAAEHIVHHPAVVARHHVPDPAQASSITTQLKQVERRLWQLRVMDKCTLMLESPMLRAYARQHRGYTLKRIAELMAEQGDWYAASLYAREGMAVLPNVKWGAYTVMCHLRRLLQVLRAQPGGQGASAQSVRRS
jgi:glycosyltransferase involved in cell wall biosynthesis